jgi:tetratricopeptide (TPR) repeat protein
LEHSIDLSPNDADLWIELGNYHAGLRDTTGAVKAYRQATRLSPGYGYAHQVLGNCLLAAGENEEAFAELRHASRIMPTLFSKNIELAWQTYKGEPQAVKQALQPESVHERIALGLFFANRSVREQSILLMKDARYLAADERRSLLQELLDTGKFEEAYEVWLSEREGNSNDIRDRASSITDGSFEGKLSIDEPGFGWRFNHDTQAVNVWLDQSEPSSGRQSLRLDWHGDADRSSRIVEQLVLVVPATRYRLSFAARTQSLTTICLPYITITSGKGENEILLGQSTPLPQGRSGWHNYSVEFSTPDSSRTIEVSVKRVAGPEGSCPIFGSVWLDDFSLIKI